MINMDTGIQAGNDSCVFGQLFIELKQQKRKWKSIRQSAQ